MTPMTTTRPISPIPIRAGPIRRRTLAALAVLAAAAAWAPPARAQTATVTAYTGQSCAGTRAGKTLGCTSNDFTTTATFTQPPPGLASCVAGSSLTLDVVADIVSHSPDRYDGALFLGEHGNDPSVADATQTCSLGLFPTSPLPFEDLNGDPVGDFAGNSTAQLTIRSVTAYCVPAPGTNVLGLPYVLVFDNNTKPLQDELTVTAGSGSKCVSTTSAQVTGVVVQGWLQLTVQTNPAGDPQTFAVSTSGTAAASPASFSLGAGGTQLVQVPLSATGGTQTLELDEAAVPGWNPAATISCTTPSGGTASYVTVDGANRRIVATLDATNFGASCTITNEKYARITVSEASAGATGPFAFSSGTNGLPATFTLDTSTANPASQTWVVATNGAPVSIAQTVPAGYTLASVGCSDASGPVGTAAGATVTLAAADVTPGREITCAFADTRKASLAKAFSPTAVGTGKPSALVFTATNSPGAPAQAGMGFTDALPAGLAVASPLAISSTCGGTLLGGGGAPLAAGDGAIAFSGGTLPAGTASCTVSVAVSAAGVGSYVNGPAQVGAFAGGLESAVTNQTLTVYPLPSLLMVKSADRASARPGDVVTYTLVVQNGGPGTAAAVVVSEPLSQLVAWDVDAFGPGVSFQFTDGSPASGITPGTPAWSADGGATWTLTPVSGGGGAPAGFDGRVTAWRLPFTGTMAGGSQFTLTFRVAVK